jgi:predicted enzyme related to lactoylglutathione lyase
MPDSFEALRRPVVPAGPRLAFAGQLRARLARFVEGSMHGNMVYVSLQVDDVGKAADFFGEALGWTYEPVNARGTRTVRGTAITQAIVDRRAAGEYYRSIGLNVPDGGSGLYFSAAVDAVASAVARVRAAGGQATDPGPSPYGAASAECLTPDGMPFGLMQPGDWAAQTPAGGRQGDLEYVTLHVPSGDRTRDFFAAVLGWQTTPGSVPDGYQVEGVRPLAGIAGGHARALAEPMYRVDDIRAAVERVRAAGGQATDPQAQPYGLTAECGDTQGTAFYLGQLPS